MSTLIVVGFKKDMYRASSVLNRLLEMDYDWTIDLHDAVAVYRDYNGKLRVDQSYQLTTGEGAAAGGFFGSLIGLTVGALAAPFTAGASLAAGAVGGGAIGALGGALDAAWWKEDFGIPEDFVADVGTLVQPGDSAIFALLRTANPDLVAEQFKGYGGTVLSSTLTPEQSKKVQSVLEGNK
jgi:uncharacterized membrane protein